MDMKTVYKMLANNEPHEDVVKRILSGKDLKPEIEKSVIVRLDWIQNDGPNKRKFEPWRFYETIANSGIHYSYLKKIFVNPDLGKQGIHS